MSHHFEAGSVTCAVTGSTSTASGLPTCTVPASVSVPGSAPVNATLTIGTQATTSAALERRLKTTLAGGAGLTFAALMFWVPIRHRSLRTLMGLLFLIAAAGAITGCNSSGSSGTTPPSGGTPAGSYSVSVTATSNNISHSTVINVVVN